MLQGISCGQNVPPEVDILQGNFCFGTRRSESKCVVDLPLPKVSTVNCTRCSQASALEISVGQMAASAAPFSRHARCTSSSFSLRLAASTNLAPLLAYSRAMPCMP